jgi:hypothetical protein
MQGLTTLQLRLACQTFLKLAYPKGPESMPPKKRVYFDLPQERPVEEFLPPAVPADVGQVVPGAEGEVRGYALRLGSEHFPHLKLKIQLMDHNGATTLVYAVDTHDAFSKTSFYPPEDHPDAAAWRELQKTNQQLKEKIETAWKEVGLMTFNGLLRSDLANEVP